MAETALKNGTNEFNFTSGDLCLDFANTAEWHASTNPQEHLRRYEDLVTWGRQAGLLSAAGAEHLLHEGRRRPVEAEKVLRRAVTLREAIYRILSRAIAREAPAAEDLHVLNEALSAALARLQVVPIADGFGWAWQGEEPVLEQMLWPIARSAAELLTSKDLPRLKQCADDRGCGWLFLDRSRNRSRRWCAMDDCGNRAKARRYYQRKRSSLAAGGG